MNIQIRQLLIEKARQNQPVYYGEIMKILGLVGGVKDDHVQLSTILAEISSFENERGRPMLSAVAVYSPETVRSNGGELHGNGFYELAEKLGKGIKNSLVKNTFGIREMNSCCAYWQNEKNYLDHVDTNGGIKRSHIEFFKPEEIAFLGDWAGRVYEKKNKEHVAAKNYIMNSLGSKTVFWSNELVKMLPGFETFNWRMWSHKGWDSSSGVNKQVARFKHYTWARIFKSGDENKDIFFTIGADSKEESLVYKLDYYFEANSHLSDHQKQIVKKNIPENLEWNAISYDEILSYDWNKLLKVTSSFIAENAHVYDKLVQLAWGGQQPNEVFKDNLRKCNPQIIKYAELPKLSPSFEGYETDFVERAVTNKELGDAGEELVLNYERNRLRSLGKGELADRVEIQKDGRGYDVLSFDDSGEEKFIEVKTTRGDQNVPFNLTINEYLFAEKNQGNYCIYRLYNYDDDLNTADYHVINNPISDLLFQPTNFKIYHKEI